MIEDEFYDLETFRSRAEFLSKASIYRLYFNLARPNSHKRGLTPWQITHQLAPRLPLDICLPPPIFLDYRLDPSGGYDPPRHPYRREKISGKCRVASGEKRGVARARGEWQESGPVPSNCHLAHAARHPSSMVAFRGLVAYSHGLQI